MHGLAGECVIVSQKAPGTASEAASKGRKISRMKKFTQRCCQTWNPSLEYTAYGRLSDNTLQDFTRLHGSILAEHPGS